MREAWIYGDGQMGPQAARMLAELAFSPRRMAAQRDLRPSHEDAPFSYPALVLVLVAGVYGVLPSRELLHRLHQDVDLRDVPVVVAIDTAGVGSAIPMFDADEIILPPLRLEELGVRIARARSRHGIVTRDRIRLGSLDIDLAAYEVRLDGEPIELTHMEYSLLELLATRPRRVHSRERLLSRICGLDDSDGAGTRTIDGHVGRLRAKLGPEHGPRICTVRNVGYRFEG